MLTQVRRAIINQLWESYLASSPQMQLINHALRKKGLSSLILDHFAIIDLPGIHTGIPQLSEVFKAIGYIERGRGYLSDKQNDFLWMAEADTMQLPAHEATPQVVVADFRLDELPTPVRRIVEKYSTQAPPCSLDRIRELATLTYHGQHDAAAQLVNQVMGYLNGRDWSLPTVDEFRTVQQFNELIAWVLIFGRRPNHFTLSVHLLNHFRDITEFLSFIEHELGLALNHEDGRIKGGREAGIAQGSTVGVPQMIQLSDGVVSLPTGFVEFVWRYPHTPDSENLRWSDYFTGFVPQYADRVIESLYINEKKDTLSKVQG